MSLPDPDQIVRVFELSSRRGRKSGGARYNRGGAVELPSLSIFETEDIKGANFTSLQFFEIVAVDGEGRLSSALEGRVLLDESPFVFDGGWVERDDWMDLGEMNDQLKDLDIVGKSMRLSLRCRAGESALLVRVQVALFCVVRATLHDWVFDTFVRSLREELRARVESPSVVQPPVAQVVISTEFDEKGEGLDRISSAFTLDEDGARTFVPSSYDETTKTLTLSSPPQDGFLVLEGLVKPTISVSSSFDLSTDSKLPLISVSSVQVDTETENSFGTDGAVPLQGTRDGFIVTRSGHETLNITLDLVLVSESSSVLMSLVQSVKDWVRDHRLLRSFGYGYRTALDGGRAVSWDTAVSDIGELKVATLSVSLSRAPSVIDYRSRGSVSVVSDQDPFVVRKIENIIFKLKRF